MFVWGGVTLLFLAIVCLNPWPLGPTADPAAAAPIGIKPEWYFLSQFQVLKLMPSKFLVFEGAHVAMAIIGAAASTMALIPFLDTGKNPTISKLATIWGVVFLIALGVLTYMGLQV